MLRKLCLLVLAAGMLGTADPASGLFEFSLAGAKHLAKFTPSKGLVKFKNDDGLIAMRNPQCPTRSFFTLRTLAVDTGMVELPCANWTFTGSGYKYLDPTCSVMGIQKIIWKSRKLTVKMCANYPDLGGPVSFVEARLTVNDKSFCGRFASLDTNTAIEVAGRGSIGCDPLPTPTPTDTPTNTPTPTSTPTPTNTAPPPPTSTPTNTGTPTNTPTPTRTFTPTNTPTNTPTPTQPPQIIISAPNHGVFTEAGSVIVTGSVITPDPISDPMEVTVNGTPVPLSPINTFTTTVPLNAADIFNPILAELRVPNTGFVARDRVVLVVGPSVTDGALSPDNIGLRINDSGFDQIEGALPQLLDLNPADLIAPGTVVDENVCLLDSFLGCLFTADRIIVQSLNFDSPGVAIDSQTNQVHGVITIPNLFVQVRIEGTANCNMDVWATTTTIPGNYALDPSAAGDFVDVTQLGSVSVSFSGFGKNFTSGICDTFEGLIDLIAGDIQGLVQDSLAGFLNTPDASGNTPVAGAIESALAGISIANDLGNAFKLNVDAPMTAIPEDNTGVTIRSDGSITSPDFVCSGGTRDQMSCDDFDLACPGGTCNSGTCAGGTNDGLPCPCPGGGACVPSSKCIDFSASLAVPEGFPSFGATAPNGSPYDVGLAVGSSTFNQLLKAQVEMCLLFLELTGQDLDIDGDGTPDFGTVGDISLLVPAVLQVMPAATPIKIRINPTLAPVVTGAPGPNGELTELVVGNLDVEVVGCVEPGPEDGVCDAGDTEVLILGGAVDVTSGFDLVVDPGGGGLVPAISEPAADQVGLVLLDNPFGADENLVNAIIVPALTPLFPQLGSSLGSIPVPTFLGLEAVPVLVDRNGDFLAIFMNLQVTP